MGTITLRLPDALHEKIVAMAERDGITLDQFLASAAAEKMAALLTEEYLEARARRGSREKLMSILDRVPSGPPDPGDEI